LRQAPAAARAAPTAHDGRVDRAIKTIGRTTVAANRVVDGVDRVPFDVDRAAGGTAGGAGSPRRVAPSVDGDTKPVIATVAGRSTVPVTEVARVTHAEAESAAETAPRASNCARIQ
jgi:hypothetical protein